MKTRNLLSLVAIAAVSLYACVKPPCICEPYVSNKLVCRITNSQGHNLVFGPQRVFITDSINALKNRNDFSVHQASVKRSFDDSLALELNFYQYKPDLRTYIYYNRQTAIDSLDITWIEKKAKCCGEPFSYYDLGELRFNGVVLQPQNGIYTFIK